MSTKIRRSAAVWLVAAAGAVMTAGLGGCNGDGKKTPESGALLPQRGAPPAYSAMAERYNERIEPLDKIFGRANIRLTYVDEKGESKTEEPEGRLQIVRPDRLALSLGKAGSILFWFGCDDERYWWFDLTDSTNRIAAVGRHDKYTDEVGRRIGLQIRPLDLIRVLGIVPLDPKYAGATQWSKDGKYVGITTAIGARGFQRIWVDPKTDMPSSIEIYDSRKKLIVTARHEGTEPVELASGRRRPAMAAEIYVRHLASETEARLTLTGLKDSGVSDKAFELQTLLEKYPVDRQIDLDVPRAPRAPAASGG